ncbi:histidine phosphatase family protein [Fulvivirga sp. M361]|uniref:SixA phosphatase family protein n=1 Tax=Fulvivirga sp. M361 TaxID=2594266 RepID=UPI00117AF832|nr:histidine phosphatase family protein [Fulvivirga sp. M361]TRX56246.1 histidine phosphatase family protein [Fulvivirga sp. M361]
MKTLYLVRHAKSSWNFPELPDDKRPLNKRGKRSAPVMGERLLKRQVLPDLLLSSPAKRALDTSIIIADVIGYPEKRIQTDSGIYHAASHLLLNIVRKTNDSINSLMMFGHNPGFTDFANRLANTDIWNIPTCGVFACVFHTEHWSNVDFGKGEVLFYDYPKRKSDTP